MIQSLQNGILKGLVIAQNGLQLIQSGKQLIQGEIKLNPFISKIGFTGPYSSGTAAEPLKYNAPVFNRSTLSPAELLFISPTEIDLFYKAPFAGRRAPVAETAAGRTLFSAAELMDTAGTGILVTEGLEVVQQLADSAGAAGSIENSFWGQPKSLQTDNGAINYPKQNSRPNWPAGKPAKSGSPLNFPIFYKRRTKQQRSSKSIINKARSSVSYLSGRLSRP